MIITQKMTYLAFSVHDGKINLKYLKDFSAELRDITPQFSAKYPLKDSHIKKTGWLVGNCLINSKWYQDPVLWAWFVFFTP